MVEIGKLRSSKSRLGEADGAQSGMTDNVLTLIAEANAVAQMELAVDTVAAALTPLGAHLLGRQWLAPRIACDLYFSDLDPDQAEAASRASLANQFEAIDVIAQPVAGRRKQLLVADLESTIIANESSCD